MMRKDTLKKVMRVALIRRLKEEIKMYCYYGCGQEANTQLQNGRWICNENWHQCPVHLDKKSEVGFKLNSKSKISKARRRLKSRYIKCVICGKQAHYPVYSKIKGNGKQELVNCCSKSISKCPDYNKYRSNLMVRRYKDIKGYRQRIALAMVECQNRPEVKEAKSKAMSDLHSDDAEFIKNYSDGRDKFRQKVKHLCKEGKHWSGPGTSHAVKHVALYKTHKKKACERCGATYQLINHMYKKGLHIHCLNKDYDDTRKSNWMTLCPLCHKIVEKEEK